MHNAILGLIALCFSIFSFIKKKRLLSLGFLFISLGTGLFFIATIKYLPTDLIGTVLISFFIIGCVLVLREK